MIKSNDIERFLVDRKWQGIPSVEITEKGNLFVVFYTGGIGEQLGNYCLVYRGNKDCIMEAKPLVVVYNGENSRCYDSTLWIDPLKRLWLIYSTQPEALTYASICENPDDETPIFGKPFVIGQDVMMNKPTVLKNGKWLFPIAVWQKGIVAAREGLHSNTPDKKAFAYITEDNGRTFCKAGGGDADHRLYDEHMFLEKNNGDIELYMRTKYGIAKCVSTDGAKTFSYGQDSGIKGPSARFHIRRLASNRVLLINHYNFKGRNNLTALLSEDDGVTYPYTLLLDERNDVSYPDVAILGEYIYIVYDRERGADYDKSPNPAKEILMAKITEEDILKGKLISKESKLKVIVNKL